MTSRSGPTAPAPFGSLGLDTPAVDRPDIRTLFSSGTTQDWRVLSGLSIYRWVLAGLLCITVYSGVAPEVFQVDRPALLPWCASLYLAAAALFTLCQILQRPPPIVQIFANVGTDIVAISLTIHAVGGIASGMGVLLFLPIAGAGILLRSRDSVLLAAMATISLLGLEFFTQIRSDPDAGAIAAAGVLGALLLIAAFVASTLSRRARMGEALAEQRRGEVLELARLNERIIRKMQIGILVVENDDRIRMLNQAAIELLDISEADIGVQISVAIPEIAAALERWRGQPHVSTGSTTIRAREQSLLLHFNVGGGNERLSTLIFIENAARIGEQAQQMKLASLGRLSASVAHEIRNPLSAISHASQLLGEFIGIKPEDQKLLDIINRHSRRINSIIEDMLSLSRRSDTHAEEVALREWTDHFLVEMREQEPQLAISLDWTAREQDLTLRVDTGHLHQVLRNLIDNAKMHAQPEDDQVRISIKVGVWPNSRRIYVDVQDNGRGIPEGEWQNIFDPFYTTSTKGTGLGLYIVRELCECNLAQLTYVPTGGIGTCFRITFARPDEWVAPESGMEAEQEAVQA